MNNQPIVSVGIPTYNRPEGLRRTLECITQQTYKNLEIIVSDNCSPNIEVGNVVKEFKAKDNRIEYFRQLENIGAANNFKFVLEKATGRYFMWASDDDEWDIHFIERLIKKMIDSPNIGLSMCQITYQVHESNENFSFPQGQCFYSIPKSAIKKLKNSTQRYGELFYGIFLRKNLHNIDFKAIDIVHPVLINAISKSDVFILNEYLFLKRVTYDVLLWTYLCAKKKSKNSYNRELDIELLKNLTIYFDKNKFLIGFQCKEIKFKIKLLKHTSINAAIYHLNTLITSIKTYIVMDIKKTNIVLNIILEVMNLSWSLIWTITKKLQYRL